jgi:hypothetical protein
LTLGRGCHYPGSTRKEAETRYYLAAVELTRASIFDVARALTSLRICLELLMSSDHRDVVGFVFAIVRKHIRTVAELQSIPAIAVQTAALRSAYKRLGWNLVGLKVAPTTYRAKSFTDEPIFNEAIMEAREKGAVLLIGDIFGSLRNLDAKAAARCFDAMDPSRR